MDTASLSPALDGRLVRLEALSARHTDDLWEAIGKPAHTGLWRYIPVGPYPQREAFTRFVAERSPAPDVQWFAILSKATRRVEGVLALMREDKIHRVIEVGGIILGPCLQRSAAATEAQYLLARHVFETLKYRRYEWKCDDRNAPSKSAATRLGFTFEGVFRQHMMVKGESRDTAWFSMLDSEWPARKAAFEAWLSPENFDAEGRQKSRLST